MISINKESDVLIPFKVIGEENWKDKTDIILKSYNELWEIEAGQPKTINEIQDLESKLGVSIPSELALFYKTYGVIDIGELLLDFDQIQYLENIWKEQPQYAPQFSKNDQKVLSNLIVFSDYLGNGNMFCFHNETEEVYYFDHDLRPHISKLFGSVSDYIRGCLITAQNMMFGDDSSPDQCEFWCENVCKQLYGSDIVVKWQY